MASANIVFGNVKGAHPVIRYNFSSQNVATGGMSTASAAGSRYCLVTAIDGPIYVALNKTATPPNANSAPRIYIPQNSSMQFEIEADVKVSVAAP